MSRHLILIRHSQTQIDPQTNATHWVLSEEGRRRSEPLARRLSRYQIPFITASSGEKAIETARLVAHHLGIESRIAEGLQEQEREYLGFVDKLTFAYALGCMFRYPDEQIMGDETGNQALARFAPAVHRVIEAQPEGDVALVSHGTVICLFAAAYSGVDGFRLWLGMGIPSYVVLALPDFRFVEVVNEPHHEDDLPQTDIAALTTV